MRSKNFSPNSVSSLIVQFPKKNTKNFSSENFFNETVACILANTKIPLIEREIVDLMYTNALRVSELLKIKGTDVISNYQFIIRASKGSRERLGSVTENCKYLLSLKGYDCYVYGDFKRQNIYYMFKRLGLSFNVKNNKNKAVTHSLRHLKIQELEKVTNDKEIVADLIGHKNTKSTEHYLNHNI